MVAKTMPTTATQEEPKIREAEHKKVEQAKKEHMQERECNYKGHAVQRSEFNLPIRRVESGGAEPIDVVTSNFDDAFPSAAESPLAYRLQQVAASMSQAPGA
jgi:hypothetical protein